METVEIITEEEDVDVLTPVRTLNRYHDRCDKCGAQAFFLAVKEGLELIFCGHHGRRFAAGLAGSGFSIEDHTDKINKEPSISATESTN